MSRRRVLALGIAGAAAIGMLASCGAPTAQVVSADESRFSFELPIEFTDIGVEDDGQPGEVYGLPESTLDQLGSDPVFLVTTVPTGERASFQSLRQLFTGGEFDPLDPDLEELPNDTELLGYIEIADERVWGIRMRLAIGRGAADFQALVDRQSDQVTVTELICTQACFVEQLDLIDRIQQSWTLGAIQ
jgi:hypothetical protein